MRPNNNPAVVDLHETLRPGTPQLAVVPGQESEIAAAVAAGGGVVAPNAERAVGVVAGFAVEPSDLEPILERMPQARWVQLPRAGVEAFIPLISRNPQIVWTSAKGCYARPVAEHALALTLALLRHLPRRVRAKSWGHEDGISLHEANVLVIGAGGVAQEIVRLMKCFPTHVTVVRRSRAEVGAADLTIAATNLHAALRSADVVIVAAALTPQTRGMIGMEELALLKPSAILVNISRGELIDTEALVSALNSDRILGAGLDVTNPEPLPDGHPLWNEPKALITPHTADTRKMRIYHYAGRVRENVRRLALGQPLSGRIDPDAGY